MKRNSQFSLALLCATDFIHQTHLRNSIHKDVIFYYFARWDYNQLTSKNFSVKTDVFILRICNTRFFYKNIKTR